MLYSPCALVEPRLFLEYHSRQLVLLPCPSSSLRMFTPQTSHILPYLNSRYILVPAIPMGVFILASLPLAIVLGELEEQSPTVDLRSD